MGKNPERFGSGFHAMRRSHRLGSQEVFAQHFSGERKAGLDGSVAPIDRSGVSQYRLGTGTLLRVGPREPNSADSQGRRDQDGDFYATGHHSGLFSRPV